MAWMKEDEIVPCMLPVEEQWGQTKADIDACMELDAPPTPVPM